MIASSDVGEAATAASLAVSPPVAPSPSRVQAVRERLAGQLVLAPLTRGGNLPFRRLCAGYGARITFSEMAHAREVVRGGSRELALLRRHADEELFGAQLAVRKADLAIRAAHEALERGADFIDVNLGCPIDGVVRKGMGAALLEKPRRLEKLLVPLRSAIDVPLFVKIRLGYREADINAVEVARVAEACGVDALTVHGRTREQRYRRPADWDRIAEVAGAVAIPVIGNGDILHARDARHRLATSGCAAVMAARGALIKPWVWEDFGSGDDRPWSAEDRLAMMRRWVALAVDQWGGDEHAFLRIRAFLEFHVDFWRRYVPSDVPVSGEDTLQGRTSFVPRTELEALLRAPDDEGIARACNLILESFDPPPAALQPSKVRRDPTAGGWS